MGVTWFYTRPLVIVLGRAQRVGEAGGRFGIARGLAIPSSPATGEASS
jgi:hypothetical protein